MAITDDCNKETHEGHSIDLVRNNWDKTLSW
jgi:hypothetical protein